MGFFDKVGGFFKKVGSGIGKAVGVVTAPIKEVWGVVKDTVKTVAHMPEKVLKSVDKATAVVGGLGNNIQASVGSAAGALVSVGDNAAVSDSVVGADARIGAGATLASADGNTLSVDVKGKRVIPELARLGSVLGDGAVVDDGVTVAAGTLVPAAETSA